MRGDNPFKIQEGAVHDRKVAGYNAAHAAGDNLLFLPDFSGWLGKNVKHKQLSYFYVAVLTLFCVLFGRIVYLQFVKGNAFYSLAENNRTKVVRLRAPRGIMYDRYEKPLLKNVNSFSLYINPQLIQNDEQARELEQLIRIEFPQEADRLAPFFTKYRTYPQEELIAEAISYDTALRMLIAGAQHAALQIVSEPRREYLVHDGMAPLLGAVGSITREELEENPQYRQNDLIGKGGIEQAYERVLRGADGFQRFEVDALGREKRELALSEPHKGTDLVLTIDGDIQKKLFSILEDISLENARAPAAGIVMDPSTGGILGMASVPSYDPSLFSGKVERATYQALLDDPRRPLFFRALGGVYPAGSVFKPVIASAALQEKMIDDRFTVMSVGGVQLGNYFFPDWRSGGHGLTNVYSAIAQSVNTFFYIVGGGSDTMPGLGIDMIDRYAGFFGFGKSTGIDLPGESQGFVPSRAWKESSGEKWYQGDTYNVSIGQGSLTVTPLQVARLMSVFASRGFLVTPHVVGSVGGAASSFQRERASFLSDETVAIVREGLRRTVTEGTAKSMQSVRVPVAGKTGTAQFNRTKDPHSWFAGFAPYDDPEIVIAIIVEEGGDRGLAVTAARRFLEWQFNER